MDEEQKKQQEAAEAAEAAKEAAADAAKKDADSDAAGSDGGEAKGDAKAGKTDAEVDAIVEKRLARERAKMEREIRQQLADEAESEQTEAEKLKNMTELQRAQYEAKKVQREKEELQERIDFTEQMAVARAELSGAGITFSDELLSMFVSSDSEKTLGAINKLKELWPKELDAAVKNALKRNPPAAEGDPSQPSYGTSYAEKYNQKMNGGK